MLRGREVRQYNWATCIECDLIQMLVQCCPISKRKQVKSVVYEIDLWSDMIVKLIRICPVIFKDLRTKVMEVT